MRKFYEWLICCDYWWRNKKHLQSFSLRMLKRHCDSKISLDSNLDRYGLFFTSGENELAGHSEGLNGPQVRHSWYNESLILSPFHYFSRFSKLNRYSSCAKETQIASRNAFSIKSSSTKTRKWSFPALSCWSNSRFSRPTWSFARSLCALSFKCPGMARLWKRAIWDARDVISLLSFVSPSRWL